MPTKLLSTDNIAIGMGKIYIGDSSTYIGTFDQALSSSDYFCGLTSVSAAINKESIQRNSTESGIKIPVETKVVSASVVLSVSFIEVNRKTLSYALGGINSDTNIFNDLLSDPNDLRVELVFTYPNGSNQMVFILPKCNISTPDLQVVFNEQGPITPKLMITNLYYSSGVWSSDPYGRVKFT